MKVQVLSDYDRVESTDASNLKRLIAEKRIYAFRRAAGWVKVGFDRIRGEGGKEYDGPERRDVIQKPLTRKQKQGRFRCILGVRGQPAD